MSSGLVLIIEVIAIDLKRKDENNCE